MKRTNKMSSRPRILTRQQSSLLNDKLDDFFVNNSSRNIIDYQYNSTAKYEKSTCAYITERLNNARDLLEEFYQTNADSTLEENVEENDNKSDKNIETSQFFILPQGHHCRPLPEILVYEYETSVSDKSKMSLPSTITQIETTGDRTIALTSSGQLYGWGDNNMNCLCIDKTMDLDGGNIKSKGMQKPY